MKFLVKRLSFWGAGMVLFAGVFVPSVHASQEVPDGTVRSQYSAGLLGGFGLLGDGVGGRAPIGAQFAYRYEPHASLGALVRVTAIESGERDQSIGSAVGQWKRLWDPGSWVFGLGANAGLARIAFSTSELSHAWPVLVLGPSASGDWLVASNVSVGAEMNLTWLSGNEVHSSSDILAAIKAHW